MKSSAPFLASPPVSSLCPDASHGQVQVMPEEHETEADCGVAARTAAVLAVLRRERESRSWTLDDLSARIDGISVQELEGLENGTIELRLRQLEQICSAFDREPASVVDEAMRGMGAP